MFTLSKLPQRLLLVVPVVGLLALLLFHFSSVADPKDPLTDAQPSAKVHRKPPIQAQSQKKPRLTVPKVARAPTIDGKMEPGEWERAAVVTGFMGANGPRAGVMDAPDAKIYLAHDGKNFYMAVYCELFPDQVPSRTYRKRDDPVYMDSNQLELWLTPPVKGQLVTYQMIGNAYGAIYDNRQVPDLGNVVAGWNGRYALKSTFVRGKYWIAELSVPFADFGVDEVSPEQEWGGLVAVAWPQRSWPYTGGWYKNVQQHAVLTFADDGDCVRLEDMSSLFGNKLAPRGTLVNGGDQDADYTLSFLVGKDRYEEKIHVPAHGSQPIALQKVLPDFTGAQQTCSLDITGREGWKLLSADWFYRPMDQKTLAPAKVPQPELPFAARVLFAPQAQGLKVWADVLDYPKRQNLASVRFRVQDEKGDRPILIRDTTDFSYDAAEAYLWLPKDLPYGKYVVSTEFLARDGSVLDQRAHPFEHTDLRKQFYWWGNQLGNKRTVNAPFTPVKTAKNTVSVWGRDHQMQGACPRRF